MEWLRYLPSITCFGGATVVAARGKGGWGWLLFVGLLCTQPIVHP